MKYQGRVSKARVAKRGERQVLSPKDIKITSDIICNHCKKPSGYKNEDLVNVKPPRDVKCLGCGKVCITITR